MLFVAINHLPARRLALARLDDAADENFAIAEDRADALLAVEHILERLTELVDGLSVRALSRRHILKPLGHGKRRFFHVGRLGHAPGLQRRRRRHRRRRCREQVLYVDLLGLDEVLQRAAVGRRRPRLVHVGLCVHRGRHVQSLPAATRRPAHPQPCGVRPSARALRAAKTYSAPCRWYARLGVSYASTNRRFCSRAKNARNAVRCSRRSATDSASILVCATIPGRFTGVSSPPPTK